MEQDGKKEEERREKGKNGRPILYLRLPPACIKALFQELFSLAANGGSVILNKLNVESTDLCYLM